MNKSLCCGKKNLLNNRIYHLNKNTIVNVSLYGKQLECWDTITHVHMSWCLLCQGVCSPFALSLQYQTSRWEVKYSGSVSKHPDVWYQVHTISGCMTVFYLFVCFLHFFICLFGITYYEPLYRWLGLRKYWTLLQINTCFFVKYWTILALKS